MGRGMETWVCETDGRTGGDIASTDKRLTSGYEHEHGAWEQEGVDPETRTKDDN